MRLLLDTHVLVWLAEGSKELPPKSRAVIDEAAKGDGLAVSAISFWEVAMLQVHGRLTIKCPTREWKARVLDAAGLVEFPITSDIGIEAAELPDTLHGDPADRMLVATARLHGLVLGTRDTRLLEYAAVGHLEARRL